MAWDSGNSVTKKGWFADAPTTSTTITTMNYVDHHHRSPPPTSTTMTNTAAYPRQIDKDDNVETPMANAKVRRRRQQQVHTNITKR